MDNIDNRSDYAVIFKFRLYYIDGSQSDAHIVACTEEEALQELKSTVSKWPMVRSYTPKPLNIIVPVGVVI